MADVPTGLDPDAASLAHGLHQQAVAAWHGGAPQAARDLMRAAISAQPHISNYHANLAMMLKDAAPPAERAHHYPVHPAPATGPLYLATRGQRRRRAAAAQLKAVDSVQRRLARRLEKAKNGNLGDVKVVADMAAVIALSQTL